jgi:hypothetical protein
MKQEVQNPWTLGLTILKLHATPSRHHSKSNAITILDSFVFYKTKGRVVKQSYKKLELLRVLELTITTETSLIANMRTNPIATTFVAGVFHKLHNLTSRI